MAQGAYAHLEVEAKWAAEWERRGTYKWDPNRPREESFIIDTPPPTVSGSLHVGHVFGYTQTDVIARFQRMLGKNVFYPIGWDDNGVPTERRVQNYFSIRCDPSLPYDPNWTATKPEEKEPPVKLVSRKNFIEACAKLTEEDEKAFDALWHRLALSYDWSQQYTTIGKRSIQLSQYSFLDLVKKGELYNAEAPTLWDVDFKTAVAQAELEDRETNGTFYDVRFEVEGGSHFIISTTRPELLAACIAVVAHPSDERYKNLFGKKAITPLFCSPVPICASEHAEPDKGTGIMMVCTFGDTADVIWWKQSKIPIRQILDRDGKIMPIQFGEAPFESLNPERANAAFRHLLGLRVQQAKKKIAELLAQEASAADGVSIALQGEPRPTKHAVKYYERGERPLEIVTSYQWFIKVLNHKEEFLAQGREVKWHPHHMLSRFESWVEGLNQDWCISRQRFFGVPIPAWYPISKDGAVQYDSPIYPSEDSLPIDPMSDMPSGYTTEQRNQPGGFVGDPDIMDTWATSALTPQIMSYWYIDPKRHKLLFPMDMRPQGPEIIRTWAFATIAKAWFHEKQIPWKHAVINGWILDPDRKKMSKSKGNVVTPAHLLDEYSVDGVRYWAAKARLGADTAFDVGVFKIGQKLVTKLLNASRFVISHFERVGLSPKAFNASDIQMELDCALVAKLKGVISDATSAFEKFDYAAALQVVEDSFWDFCDNYLEIVKKRAYLESDCIERRSAVATLGWALKTFLRLFAPFVPYVTEQLWSESFAGDGRDNSVHNTLWPKLEEVKGVRAPASDIAWKAIVEIIGKIRGAKTIGQKSLKWPVTSLTIRGIKENCAALSPLLGDIIDGGNVSQNGIIIEEVDDRPTADELFEVQVVLGE